MVRRPIGGNLQYCDGDMPRRDGLRTRRWRRQIVAIAQQSITQRILESAEPWFEMSPLIEALAKDGLADLFRAGGADAALRFVELHPGRLEVQSAEIEEPAHVGFEILDHILVIDTEHFPRQRLVPVLHQVEIRPVVPRDVRDAIGELLSVGKQLLEIAEAAGHRFTARVDDPRVRQHQMDETDMPEVIRHLVDEMRLVGSIDPRIRQVFFAEPQEIVGRQLREYPWIAWIRQVGLAPLELVDDSGNVRKLLRAFDARMRGEDLLEQSGPGAGQPDDENRIGTVRAHSAAAREEPAGANLLLQPGIEFDGLGPVAAFGFLQG